MASTNYLDLLRDLVRLDTTNPPGNEGAAAELLRSALDAAGTETYIHTGDSGRPSLIAQLPGPTDVPALVLVSHTDVVGVEEDCWSHDPFGGDVADGHLWGRGALDMKGIAVMHAAAVIAAASGDNAPSREVIFVSFADEEAGGRHGAELVLREVPERLGFRDGRPLPVALGEGAFGLTEVIDRPLMPIVVGEKAALWLKLTAVGEPGHGALPPQRQANVNLARAVAKISGYATPRVHPVMREQFATLARHSGKPRSLVFNALASAAGSQVGRAIQKPLRKQGVIASLLADTITPTRLEAGYKHNVVPGEAKASFDCRLLPDTDIDSLLKDLSHRCERYGVTVSEMARHSSGVSRRGAFFAEVERASAAMVEAPIVVPSLTAGMTDLRFFRQRGASAYGWVPLVLAPDLLATIHGHDERIPVEAFERGVQVMTEVVGAMAART